jgi:hypothetical protein
VAFDAETVGVPLNPQTFADHLDFATEYQLAMYRLGSKSKREETRPHVRHALATRYSLMDLRALFLFAVAEHEAEVAKGGRLNELERAAVWAGLERQRWIVLNPKNNTYAATDAAEHVKYEN